VSLPLAPRCCRAALPKGGVTADHVLIVPIQHTEALATAPPQLRAEVGRFLEALGRMWAATGKGAVAFERVLQSRRGETPVHTHLQVRVG
jgi:diadenosine tetraphosphate (Ap4A) HIT family hydrolase